MPWNHSFFQFKLMSCIVYSDSCLFLSFFLLPLWIHECSHVFLSFWCVLDHPFQLFRLFFFSFYSSTSTKQTTPSLFLFTLISWPRFVNTCSLNNHYVLLFDSLWFTRYWCQQIIFIYPVFIPVFTCFIVNTCFPSSPTTWMTCFEVHWQQCYVFVSITTRFNSFRCYNGHWCTHSNCILFYIHSITHVPYQPVFMVSLHPILS